MAYTLPEDPEKLYKLHRFKPGDTILAKHHNEMDQAIYDLYVNTSEASVKADTAANKVDALTTRISNTENRVTSLEADVADVKAEKNVLYTEQVLSESEKTQAQINIGVLKQYEIRYWFGDAESKAVTKTVTGDFISFTVPATAAGTLKLRVDHRIAGDIIADFPLEFNEEGTVAPVKPTSDKAAWNYIYISKKEYALNDDVLISYHSASADTGSGALRFDIEQGLSSSQKAQAQKNLGIDAEALTVDMEGVVRFDKRQSLNSEDIARAKANLEIHDFDITEEDLVRYDTEQTLTEAQQKQAQRNIGVLNEYAYEYYFGTDEANIQSATFTGVRAEKDVAANIAGPLVIRVLTDMGNISAGGDLEFAENPRYIITPQGDKYTEYTTTKSYTANEELTIVFYRTAATQADGALHYDMAQSLSEKEQATVRTNIGLNDIDALTSGNVKYDTANQGLTDTEKSNARTNIGTISSTELDNMQATVNGELNTLRTDISGAVVGVSENDGIITVSKKDGTKSTFALPAGLAFDGGYCETDNETGKVYLHLTLGADEIANYDPIELPIADGLAFDGGSCERADEESPYYLYLTKGAVKLSEDVFEPIALPQGIGGGGSVGGSISLSDTTIPTSVRNDADAIFSFIVTTSDASEVAIVWSVDNVEIETTQGDSGDRHTFNAKGYLKPSASSKVTAAMSSTSGATLKRTWTITSTPFSLSWGGSIEPIMLYTSEDNVYVVVNVTAQQRSVNTVTLAVGEHSKSQSVTGTRSITVSLDKEWFTTGVNTVTANMVSDANPDDAADEIYFVAMWGPGATGTIVAFADKSIEGVQYDNIPVRYFAYNPTSETAEVTLQMSGEEARTVSVGRTVQEYMFVPQTFGNFSMSISSGDSTDTVDISVTKNQYNIASFIDESLRYSLDPTGHSNNDNDRTSFAGLTFSPDFNWTNGGFLQDASGCPAFVVKKGSSVTLPRSLFADNDANGKTIDISFRIANAEKYDADAASDLNNPGQAGSTVGLELKANEGVIHINNAAGQVFRYCEETRIDLSIHVESVVDQRLVTVWLDGIPSSANAYTAGDLVQNENPMIIGSQYCDVWIYAIRAYNSALTEQDMIQNYISLGSTTQEKIARSKENEVYDEGQKITSWYSHQVISPASLHRAAPDLTIITIAADRMTVSKKDPVPADITIQDGTTVLELQRASGPDAKDGALFKVQGTSSVAYGRSALNMDMDFKGCGVKYQISPNAIGVNYLNIKVNVASSENANNVCAVDWYNAMEPFLIEARKNNPSIRDTVEGKPCAVFFTNTGSAPVWISSQLVEPGETTLYVMGDLCNSKKNTEVFGEDGAGEHPTKACIEVSGNDTEPQRFRATAEYSVEREEWDELKGYNDQGEAEYTKHFEWRMDPSEEDLQEVVDSWNAAVAWVVSTIDNPTKFKNELHNYFTVTSMLYHFLMIEYFAAYDDVSKNTFYSYDYDADEGGYRWNVKEAYDWDTILGCDNDGIPLGDYGLDYGDTFGGRSYFNGVTNTIWNNIQAAFQSELSTLYASLRSKGAWDSGAIIAKWDNYQAKRPHAAMVRDAYVKYIYPYKTTGVIIDGKSYLYDDNYIPRLRGSKTYQRRQFLTYQSDYMDGKYGYYSKTNSLQFRTNCDTGVKTFEFKAYAKTYITVLADDNKVGSKKVEAGGTITFDNVSVGNNTTLYVTPDRLIQYIHPLNETLNTTFGASGASKLMEAILGSSEVNNAWPAGGSVNIPSPILKQFSIQNMTNFNSQLMLTPNVELETIDTRGTNAGRVTIAPYAPVTSIQLNACSGISMSNLQKVTTFTMPNGNSLVYISVSNCNELIQTKIKDLLLDAFQNGGNATKSVRLIDVNWTLSDTTLLNYLLNAQGIDANGNVLTDSSAVVTGHISVASAYSTEMAKYEKAWPGVVSTANMIEVYEVKFQNWDDSALKDKQGNDYSQYVRVNAQPYDPIEAGEIDTPVRPTDDAYTYVFKSFDGINTRVIGDGVVVTATYTGTLRKFTYVFYDDVEPYGQECYRVENVSALSEVIFKGGDGYDLPHLNSERLNNEEDTLVYRVFKGWDKSTGSARPDPDNPTSDIVRVHALWETARLPQAGEKSLHEMNLAEIYSVAKQWYRDHSTEACNEYWETGDYFDFKLGHDFNFSNVDSTLVIGGDGALYGDGNPMFFDGTNGFRTDIALFSPDTPSWTMAIDYEFYSNTTDHTLVSCFDTDGNRGFRLRYSGNYSNIQWGDKNVNIAYERNRHIVVLRHRAGTDDVSMKNLYVHSDWAATNDGSTVSNNDCYSNDVYFTGLARTTEPWTDFTLSFGGTPVGDTNMTNRGQGTVYWCKIWWDDLGRTVSNQIAVWPREDFRLAYNDIPAERRYELADGSGYQCAGMFAAECALAQKHRENLTSTNAGGYAASDKRKFLHGYTDQYGNWIRGHFFRALPFELQFMIPAVRIASSAGSQSSEVTLSDNLVYDLSYQEVVTSTLGEPYRSEGFSYPIFSDNGSRARFPGIIRALRAPINAASAPTMTPEIYESPQAGGEIQFGQVWWNADGCYVFVPQDYVQQHIRIGNVLYEASADTIDAGNGRGKWVKHTAYFLRSPYVGNTASFYFVYTAGAAGNYGSSASGAYGVVVGLPI